MGSSLLVSTVAKRLEGKVALITGGFGGLGAATAKLFLQHGAKVVIADINRGDHHSLPVGDGMSFVHCDVTRESHVQSAVDEAVSKHGKLDIMFNNAGILDRVSRDIADCSQADFEHVLRVNVAGVFLGTKHAARAMRRGGGGGAIINTASVCGVVGGVATHAYTSSKYAVVGLTRNASVELGRYGIRVNCVSPFVFPSRISRSLLGRAEEDPMDDVKLHLMGKKLEPEDVAEAVVYLASDESRCVNGHNLIVDGGFTITNSAFTIFD
ncbi:hypothetical protein SASPL_101321 [Salvia splendens]|uniref:(+)-borneol dehydrogenase n=1 Tax=Salvia splendens TaxID=180675 RepID=A0A8X9ACD7_SALSN|nr:secoisolariciresinol dehydrogenase-like [Salvia splendens]KAG6436423.1 hypothetical protein SASPL_101321 [Salvia splendens]